MILQFMFFVHFSFFFLFVLSVTWAMVIQLTCLMRWKDKRIIYMSYFYASDLIQLVLWWKLDLKLKAKFWMWLGHLISLWACFWFWLLFSIMGFMSSIRFNKCRCFLTIINRVRNTFDWVKFVMGPCIC